MRLPQPLNAGDGASKLSSERLPAVSVARYRPMLRLLDREDLEFIRLHGADAAHFRRQRYRTFLRFVTSLDREIERSLRQRLLHENWDMLEIAREKFWVRIRIWDLRLAAMLYLMGWSADLSLIQQHVVDLIRVSQPVSTPA